MGRPALAGARAGLADPVSVTSDENSTQAVGGTPPSQIRLSVIWCVFQLYLDIANTLDGNAIPLFAFIAAIVPN